LYPQRPRANFIQELEELLLLISIAGFERPQERENFGQLSR
jgi:hypothetical protein